MKKFCYPLLFILAVGCDRSNDPDETKKPGPFAHLVGEYVGFKRWESGDGSITLLVKDSVVSVTEGRTDSTLITKWYEIRPDKDGNFTCCNGTSLSFRNDTLITSKTTNVYNESVTEIFIGVRKAKSQLKAGSVGFRSASSETVENDETTDIALDIEGAKYGAAVVIDILETSTGVYGKDFTTLPGRLNGGLLNSTIVVYVGPNVNNSIVRLKPINDLIPNGKRKIELKISDRCVGITPSNKTTHSFTLIENDSIESSVNKILLDAYKTHFPDLTEVWGELHDINSDGTGLRQVTDYAAADPSFSPDGKRVVFVKWQPNGICTDCGIRTMNYGGGEVRKVTDGWAAYNPLFSPNGDKIFFIKHLGKYFVNTQIFSVNLDGTGETQVSHIGALNEAIEILDFSFSPDGKQIVYTCNVGNEGMGHRIHIMDSDGSNSRRLTNKYRHEQRPKFSPDGQKIIFDSSYPDGYMHLTMINSDGTEEKKFFNLPDFWSYGAIWSPDGQRIAFVGQYVLDPYEYDILKIFTAKIDGSDLKEIAVGNFTPASWSPSK